MPRKSPVTRQFDEYFDALIDEMVDRGLIERGDVEKPSGAPRGCDRRVIKTAFPRLEYRVGFWGGTQDDRKSADVYLWIARDGGDNPAVFHCFRRQRASIEEALGSLGGNTRWHWKLPTNFGNNYCSIGVTQPFRMQDLQDRPDDLRAWMIEFLPRLQRALDPYIPKCGRLL